MSTKEIAINISTAGTTTAPGNNATTVLWDSTLDFKGTSLAKRRQYPNICRATVRIYADQVVTLKCNDIVVGSTTWRTYNNGGSGDATTANTWFEKNVLFVGDDHQLTVTAGGTGPTVWECSVKLWMDPSLAQ